MLYVILIAAIIVFWLVAVDRPILKVTFSDGKIVTEKGHFPPSFRHNVLEIAHRTPFSGELKVYQQRSGTKLVMSKEINKSVQQRIRNVFPFQGFRSKGNKKAN